MSRQRIGAATDLQTLAAMISGALDRAGIDAILSGGAVVSIYTHNEFESRDLDWISDAPRQQLDEVMRSLGFMREVDRYYRHPQTAFVVEFPAGPLMAGREALTAVNELKSAAGTIRLLTPTDAVKDRLAGFLHWSDRQSLEQALAICRSQSVNLKEVARWARQEGQPERYAVFESRLSAAIRSAPDR